MQHSTETPGWMVKHTKQDWRSSRMQACTHQSDGQQHVQVTDTMDSGISATRSGSACAADAMARPIDVPPEGTENPMSSHWQPTRLEVMANPAWLQSSRTTHRRNSSGQASIGNQRNRCTRTNHDNHSPTTKQTIHSSRPLHALTTQPWIGRDRNTATAKQTPMNKTSHGYRLSKTNPNKIGRV